MARTYLVTGGLGFIGAPLVQALVRKGNTVRVLDNSSRGSVEKLGDVVGEVEIVEGDIRDPVLVSRSVEGVESVIHLAFVNGTEFFYQRPAYVMDVGVKGMVNIIDSCVRHGVKEFILASSSEVYQTPLIIPTDETAPLSVPDPLNPRYSYGGGKIISELMAVNYGRNHFKRILIFRPHNVYGPAMGWEHVIPQFVCRLKELRGSENEPIKFPIQGDGSQTRAFIYIDDFTDGLMKVLEKGEHLNIYHIGTMEEVAIHKLAQEVAKAAGLIIEVVPGPEVEGGTPRRCADNAKIKALGFEQSFTLAEGLKPTVSWYLEHEKPLRSATLDVKEVFIT
ncbi:MAG: NAD-dependent epimerase/dehydratase family protein [Patescibacteria group bacterium]